MDAARAGDTTARDAIVAAHMRLVVAIARPLGSSHVAQEDLIQEGAVALARAIDRFNPSLGMRVNTFVRKPIRGAMLDLIERSTPAIQVTPEQHDILRAVWEISERYVVRFGTRPGPSGIDVDTWASLGGATGPPGAGWIRHEDMLWALAIEGRRIAVVNHEPAVDLSLAEVVSRQEERHRLLEAVSGLPEEEAEVISLRFGLSGDDPRQLHEIATLLGISRIDVRRAERRAQQQLRLILGGTDALGREG